MSFSNMETPDNVYLASCEWTRELVEFMLKHRHTTIPAKECQRALRTLPSASTDVFTLPPFNVNAVFVYLLNKSPCGGDAKRVIPRSFDVLKGLSKWDLYWKNLNHLEYRPGGHLYVNTFYWPSILKITDWDRIDPRITGVLCD